MISGTTNLYCNAIDLLNNPVTDEVLRGVVRDRFYDEDDFSEGMAEEINKACDDTELGGERADFFLHAEADDVMKYITINRDGIELNYDETAEAGQEL